MIGLIPPLKKMKHVFAHVVVFINVKARTRRVKTKFTYSMSGDTVVRI